MKHDAEQRRENPKEKEMVRDRPALLEEIPGKRDPDRKSPSVKENPANMLRFPKRAIVHNGMPVIIGIRLSVLFFRELQTCE